MQVDTSLYTDNHARTPLATTQFVVPAQGNMLHASGWL